MTKIETNRIMELYAGLVSPIIIYVGFLKQNGDFQFMNIYNRYEVKLNLCRKTLRYICFLILPRIIIINKENINHMKLCENGKPRNTVATCDDCHSLPIYNRRCSAHLSSDEQLNLGYLPSFLRLPDDLYIELISLLPVMIQTLYHIQVYI